MVSEVYFSVGQCKANANKWSILTKHLCISQKSKIPINSPSGGVIVGAVVQRNGYLTELGIIIPGQEYYYGDYSNYMANNR